MLAFGTAAARCALTVLLLYAAAAADPDPWGPRRALPVPRPRGCSQAEPLGLVPVLLALLFVGLGGGRRAALAQRTS